MCVSAGLRDGQSSQKDGEGQPAESLSSEQQHMSLKGQAMQTLTEHLLCARHCTQCHHPQAPGGDRLIRGAYNS